MFNFILDFIGRIIDKCFEDNIIFNANDNKLIISCYHHKSMQQNNDSENQKNTWMNDIQNLVGEDELRYRVDSDKKIYLQTKIYHHGDNIYIGVFEPIKRKLVTKKTFNPNYYKNKHVVTSSSAEYMDEVYVMLVIMITGEEFMNISHPTGNEIFEGKIKTYLALKKRPSTILSNLLDTSTSKQLKDRQLNNSETNNDGATGKQIDGKSVKPKNKNVSRKQSKQQDLKLASPKVTAKQLDTSKQQKKRVDKFVKLKSDDMADSNTTSKNMSIDAESRIVKVSEKNQDNRVVQPTDETWYDLLAKWIRIHQSTYDNSKYTVNYALSLIRNKHLMISRVGMVNGYRNIKIEGHEIKMNEFIISLYGIPTFPAVTNRIGSKSSLAKKRLKNSVFSPIEFTITSEILQKLIANADNHEERTQLESFDIYGIVRICCDRLTVKPSKPWLDFLNLGELYPYQLDHPVSLKLRTNRGPGRCLGSKHVLLHGAIPVIITVYECSTGLDLFSMRIVLYDVTTSKTLEYRVSPLERKLLFEFSDSRPSTSIKTYQHSIKRYGFGDDQLPFNSSTNIQVQDLQTGDNLENPDFVKPNSNMQEQLNVTMNKDCSLIDQVISRFNIVFCNVSNKCRRLLVLTEDHANPFNKMTSKDFPNNIAIYGDSVYDIIPKTEVEIMRDYNDNIINTLAEANGEHAGKSLNNTRTDVNSDFTSLDEDSVAQLEKNIINALKGKDINNPLNDALKETIVDEIKSAMDRAALKHKQDTANDKSSNTTTISVQPSDDSVEQPDWTWALAFNRSIKSLQDFEGNLMISIGISMPLHGFFLQVYDPVRHRESFQLLSYEDSVKFFSKYNSVSALLADLNGVNNLEIPYDEYIYELIEELLSCVKITKNEDMSTSNENTPFNEVFTIELLSSKDLSNANYGIDESVDNQSHASTSIHFNSVKFGSKSDGINTNDIVSQVNDLRSAEGSIFSDFSLLKSVDVVKPEEIMKNTFFMANVQRVCDLQYINRYAKKHEKKNVTIKPRVQRNIMLKLIQLKELAGIQKRLSNVYNNADILKYLDTNADITDYAAGVDEGEIGVKDTEVDNIIESPNSLDNFISR